MAVDELRSLALLAGLDEAQLSQLDAAGDTIAFAEGDILFNEGDSADFWWVLLDGHVELLRRSGHELSVISVMDRPGLWAGGFRAWSDSPGYLATARAAGPGRAFRVPSVQLGELVRSWFPFGVHLIVGFFQTVRMMEALSRQRGSLVALGKIAAGLAHELNNPASAATRAVDALRVACDSLLVALVELAEGSLSAEQFMALNRLRLEIDVASTISDPLGLADREEAIGAWLEQHGVADSWDLAPPLALAGVDVSWCERVALALGPSTLGPGLEWVTGTLSASTLLAEIKEATGRVFDLVESVKSYSQLDRASLQTIDVTEGIESTLVMLGEKLQGVEVVRDYAEGVPHIEAIPGELNQVWTNLVDNAIDAMDGTGTLRISTQADGDHVVVHVADTGTGMSADAQARAFEAFFTTKDVGKGTGLGLDISRRIVVDGHHGTIEIESRPGETVLTVTLPIVRA